MQTCLHMLGVTVVIKFIDCAQMQNNKSRRWNIPLCYVTRDVGNPRHQLLDFLQEINACNAVRGERMSNTFEVMPFRRIALWKENTFF